MARRAVKVYLTDIEYELLMKTCGAIGEDVSALIKSILLTYMKDINLIREAVHGK